MAKSDLLKEAIADANAVKQTALANAKIALQEAFAPRIQRMISDQIENELDGEEEMPAEDPAMDPTAGEEMAPEGDDFTWTDDSLSATVGGNDYDFTVGMGGEDEMTDEMPEEMPASDEEMPASDEEMGAEYNEGMHDDLDLEEIIRELEGDAEKDMAPDTEIVDEYADTDENMYEEEMAPEGDESMDDIIEAILREAEEGDSPYGPPVEKTDDLSEELEDTKEELADTEEKLTEAYNTVKKLKSIINEVNLLNAKLLYTNKLFRNYELSENQKMKVIENFDRATNTREVKLVFTTIAESFKRPTTKRVVKESLASRAVNTTAPSTATRQVLGEGFELANRWKKLAGLL
jgi:hypothetical protein